MQGRGLTRPKPARALSLLARFHSQFPCLHLAPVLSFMLWILQFTQISLISFQHSHCHFLITFCLQCGYFQSISLPPFTTVRFPSFSTVSHFPWLLLNQFSPIFTLVHNQISSLFDEPYRVNIYLSMGYIQGWAWDIPQIPPIPQVPQIAVHLFVPPTSNFVTPEMRVML